MARRKKEKRIFIGDFETTVYEGQTNTEVWASALVELGTEDVSVVGSIDRQIFDFEILNTDMIVYYHNLKFDGTFWVSWLLNHGYHLCYEETGWKKPGEMEPYEFRTTISDRGQWYVIEIALGNGHHVEIRDSLKLIPLSVKNIGKSYGTRHQKLEMEYVGKRAANCRITPEEREYIANDVLVVKEALEIMFSEGHEKLTIGACCMSEFRSIFEKSGAYDWNEYFPDLTRIKTPLCEDYDHYIRKSYKGGWCYVKKEMSNKIHAWGITLDVNSLYPSVMHSVSGCRYPVGLPIWWDGDIPEEALENNHYFFVKFTCRFKIKKGFLPFVQIKGDSRFDGTEMLETSDVLGKDGKYHRYYLDENMEEKESRVTITMTCSDWWLFNAHYEIYDLKVHSGCWFRTEVGLFDEYINKWMDVKMKSKGGKRQIAKLFLNNLYGKFASSTDSSFKVLYLDEQGVLRFVTVQANDKTPGFIPIGAAITSYAREFTIRAAQKNAGIFCYADTDSIHCLADPSSGCNSQGDKSGNGKPETQSKA